MAGQNELLTPPPDDDWKRTLQGYWDSIASGSGVRLYGGWS